MRLLRVFLLLGMCVTSSVLFAQEGSEQELEQELENLKNEVEELKGQLKSLENIDKLELAEKYVNAQDKLLNTEFDYLKRRLGDSNRNSLIVTIGVAIGLFGLLGKWAKDTMQRRIENTVEANLEGFKEALKQLEKLEDAHTFSVLYSTLGLRANHPTVSQATRFLQKDLLLRILHNGEYSYHIRYRAAEVLIENKIIDAASDLLQFVEVLYEQESQDTEIKALPHIDRFALPPLVDKFPGISTKELHDGLMSFLKRLLSEGSVRSKSFIPDTALALGVVSVRLHLQSSVSLLGRAIPHLISESDFDRFVQILGKIESKKSTECIKKILMSHTNARPEVEKKCLEILADRDPDFVANYRAASEGGHSS